VHPKDTASAKVCICKYCERSKHRAAVKALHDGFKDPKGPKQTAAGAPKAKPTADVRVKDSAKSGKWGGWIDYSARTSNVTPAKRYAEVVTLNADIERLRAQGVPQSVIEIVKESIPVNAADVDPVSLFTSAKQKLANHDTKIASMDAVVLDALSKLKEAREDLAMAKQDRQPLVDKLEEARAAIAAVPATPATAPQVPIIHAESLFHSFLVEFAEASADPGAQAFCGAFKAFVDTKNAQTQSTPDIHMSASPFNRIGLTAAAPARPPPTAIVFPVHVLSASIDQQGRPLNSVGPFRGRGRSNSQPPTRHRSSSRSQKRRKEDEAFQKSLDQKEAKPDALAQADAAIAATEAESKGMAAEDRQQL